MGRHCSVLALLLACATPVRASDLSVESVPDALTPGIFLEEPSEQALPRNVTPRRITEKGLALVKAFEGFRAKLYNDAAGYCSIGYGHLIKKAPCDGTEPAEMRNGLSEQAAAELLRRDLNIAETAATAAITATLRDEQHDAVVSFIFNVGSGNFRSSTLLRVLNNGPESYNEVRLQLRRWVKAGGRTWPGLQRRREREADLFFDEVGEPRVPMLDLPQVDIREGE